MRPLGERAVARNYLRVDAAGNRARGVEGLVAVQPGSRREQRGQHDGTGEALTPTVPLHWPLDYGNRASVVNRR